MHRRVFSCIPGLFWVSFWFRTEKLRYADEIFRRHTTGVLGSRFTVVSVASNEEIREYLPGTRVDSGTSYLSLGIGRLGQTAVPEK